MEIIDLKEKIGFAPKTSEGISREAYTLPYLRHISPVEPPAIVDVDNGIIYFSKEWIVFLAKYAFGTRSVLSMDAASITRRGLKKALYGYLAKYSGSEGFLGKRFAEIKKKRRIYSGVSALTGVSYRNAMGRYWRNIKKKYQEAFENNDKETLHKIEAYILAHFSKEKLDMIRSRRVKKVQKKNIVHKRINDFAGVLTYEEATKVEFEGVKDIHKELAELVFTNQDDVTKIMDFGNVLD